MKKKTVVILISCLVLLAVTVFLASNLFHMGKFRLSALSEKQCKQFLLDQGITISEELSDANFRDIIASIEKNPDREYVMGWTTAADLLRAIRDVVNAYYGITPQGG